MIPKSTAPRIEAEFKLQLTGAEDMQALIAALLGESSASPPAVVQLNEFYDTPGRGFGRELRILRLREEDGSFLLTAKGRIAGLENEGALMRQGEEEIEIDTVWARAIHAGVLCPLAALEEGLGEAGHSPVLEALRAAVGSSSLEPVGTFRNERRKVGPAKLGEAGSELTLLFEFDRTEFPGDRIDWEVEIEVEAQQEELASKLLQQLFAKAGVPWRASSTKAQRFFQALRESGATT